MKRQVSYAVPDSIPENLLRDLLDYDYQPQNEIAEITVRDTLNAAINAVAPYQTLGTADAEEESLENNIYWPTVNTFTVETGMQKIKECINLWKLNSEWTYLITKDAEWKDECSRYFGYTVSSKNLMDLLGNSFLTSISLQLLCIYY